MVLVHDHASADPTPSRADIQMTRTLVIVGKSGHASFRGLKLF